MFITSGDLFAIAIALGTSVALVITSAVQNARLTKSRDYWRQIAQMSDNEKALWFSPDCQCQDHQTENVR